MSSVITLSDVGGTDIVLDFEGTEIFLGFEGKEISLGFFAGVAQGESNTAANVGAGAGVFRDKVGAVLNLRSVTAGAGITVTENADEIDIAVTGGAVEPWKEDEFIATNGQVTFILSAAPQDGVTLSFLVNGVRTNETEDWIRSGQTITWQNNEYVLAAGDIVHAHYR
jgi:hypothetical protein